MVDERSYPPRPILGVGALIIQDKAILLVERGREPLRGFWSLPGGVVETGELLEVAVRREVAEETGLAVDPLHVVEIFERILPDDQGRTRHHYVLIDYLCAVRGGTLQAGDDASAVRWVPHDELADYRITAGTLPVIEKAYRGLLVD